MLFIDSFERKPSRCEREITLLRDVAVGAIEIHLTERLDHKIYGGEPLHFKPAVFIAAKDTEIGQDTVIIRPSLSAIPAGSRCIKSVFKKLK